MADGTSGRIRIKIGDAEFDAEGPASLINSQFERFIAAVEGRKSATASPAARKAVVVAPALPEEQHEDDGVSANGDLSPLPTVLLDRLYQRDANGLLSLRILPSTAERDADALLLLLYGYGAVKNQTDVAAGDLKRAARQSGIVVDRIDRAIATHKAGVVDGGRGKGKRYGLNNIGTAQAAALAKSTVG